jgi:alkylation response protein AidB-like acyl-CoA dehydrogenase
MQDHDYAVRFTKEFARKGWRVMHWPKEYGGMELDLWLQVIFGEELAYRGVPGASDLGVSSIGPMLMKFGSEAQKQQYLPAIANAQISFCQLFTEPGSGSDLASLQTRAVRDGDDYVINGQKCFTSGAHHSDHGWLTARTDTEAPKHRGISTFLIDMKTPGITVRPMINITGVHDQNEVFFDDVRIPADTLVGEENRGWYQIATSLDSARSSVPRFTTAKRALDVLTRYVKETKGPNGYVLAKDPAVRARLAELAIEIEVGRFLGYQSISLQYQGVPSEKEASASKVLGTELHQRLNNAALNIMGLYGALKHGSKHAPLMGQFEFYYKESVYFTIGFGTSEINRNIIASRGLGLPR